MLKNLFIRIFKPKQYRESIEIMNKLLGIEKSNNCKVFNFTWDKGNKHISLYNYKNAWIKNNNKPKYTFYTNGAKDGDFCYDFHLFIGYSIFNYTNFNFRPKKRNTWSKINERG